MYSSNKLFVLAVPVNLIPGCYRLFTADSKGKFPGTWLDHIANDRLFAFDQFDPVLVVVVGTLF